MTYNPATPQAADRISDTQQPILTNFEQANTIFAEDHFTFNDGSGPQPPPGLRGFHKKSVYKVLDAPPPTAFAEIGTVYNETTNGRSDLFYRYDTSTQGNSKVYPITAIKAMAHFVVATSAILSSYNVSGIVLDTGVSTITFADPLDTNAPDSPLDYIIVIGNTLSLVGSPRYVVPTLNTSFDIVGGGATNVSFVVLSI